MVVLSKPNGPLLFLGHIDGDVDGPWMADHSSRLCVLRLLWFQGAWATGPWSPEVRFGLTGGEPRRGLLCPGRQRQEGEP